MKRIIHVLILGLVSLPTWSQCKELVLNGSFEVTQGQLPCVFPTIPTLEDYWASAPNVHNGLEPNYIFSGANLFFSDVTNPVCQTNLQQGLCGSTCYQAPRTGRNYGMLHAYIFMYDISRTQYIRSAASYIRFKLSAPLQIGKTYDVEYFLHQVVPTSASTNNISAHFSVDGIYERAIPIGPDNLYGDLGEYILRTPHIPQNSIISNIEGWQRVSGSFTADQPYQYITIGNFNFPSTQITSGDSTQLYYFLEDVSVRERVTPLAFLPEDTTVCKLIPFEVNISPQLDSLWWNDGDTSRVKWIRTTGQYSIVGQDSNFCIYRDTFNITQKNCNLDVSIPNVFTPNQDGINDVLRLDYENVDWMKLKIYNRWGELVFETEQLSQYWNGTSSGKMVSDGVYYYHLIAGNETTSETRQGTIHVLK